ncbi:MAG: hypothetical protein KBF75_09235 [Saprospiraceae bacterium]|jgi:hypothetical protein|nr:hypothetical protein [Saprospiraceae bacterium]
MLIFSGQFQDSGKPLIRRSKVIPYLAKEAFGYNAEGWYLFHPFGV